MKNLKQYLEDLDNDVSDDIVEGIRLVEETLRDFYNLDKFIKNTKDQEEFDKGVYRQTLSIKEG